MSTLKIIHQKGMPLGWVVKDGISCPSFICKATGKPIGPNNPGMLYWSPKTGEMIVLSDEGRDPVRKSKGSEFYTTELDVLSYYLFQNTAGRDRTKTQKRAREAAKSYQRF